MHGCLGRSQSVTRNWLGALHRARGAVAASVCFLASALLLHGQTLSFSTLAGAAGGGSANGTGAAARFANPWGVAVDGAGNVYVADTDNHTIRKITSAGVVTTLAGQAGVSGSANGTGTGAQFNQPQGVAVDGAGTVYVADTGNHMIRKITSAGVVSTLAGQAGVPGSNNATGTAAHFYEPEGIAINSAGTLIYVADTWNHTLRKITSAGVVSTLAGSVGNPGATDASGTSARFNQPQGVAVDGAGTVYVGDTGNHTVRKVSSGGGVTTLAGTAGNYGSTNATGGGAAFWGPQGLAVDGAGNVYVADAFNHTLRKVTAGGAVTTFAGTAGSLGSANGAGAAARFWLPCSVAVDSSTNLYVADCANGIVRKITPGAVVSTLAGSASAGSADGTGSTARFAWPGGAAIDSATNSYVADTGNGTIRRITAAGVVSTLAGLAGNFGSTDGTGSTARFYGPQGVAVDNAGNVYVADTANQTIRKITSGGVASTLVGTAGSSGVEDGTGASARFNFPQDVAVDNAGNVYVADTGNHTIRKVTVGGVVSTLAGVPELFGSHDDANPGNGTNQARFNGPGGVAVDASGNVYVADTRNHVIRQVTPSGTVSTLAGQAGVVGSADGTNGSARFNLPQAIAVDAYTNLYVLDSGNHTVRLVALLGTNWVVSTIAGLPTVSGSADGAGANAQFAYPAGIGVNNMGSLAVADWGNNTLRAGLFPLNARPLIAAQPQDLAANQGQSASFSVVAAGSPPLAYQWCRYGTNLSGATTTSYTLVNAQPANEGLYTVVVTNSLGAITSATATLTVIVPPAITNGPQSITVNQYGNATFTVGASGTAPAYQWLFNGGTIAAATDSSYTRFNVQPSDAGSYSVIVSNSAGSTTSPPAVLTVYVAPTPPNITAQPTNVAVARTSNAVFSVTASGTAPLSYQWRCYGTNLSGAGASSYTVANVQAANGGPYSVVVTNAHGAQTSATATLTVLYPPIISVPPTNQLTFVGSNVTFNVALSQGANPAYQWRQNGSPIAGATQASYTVTSAAWADAGTYSVVVTNSDGSATSVGALLVVQQDAFTFFEGFESDNPGFLPNNWGGPNATGSNPWWSLNSGAQSTVTNAVNGITPHSGSRMVARETAAFLQDYVNLPYRFNAGQPYYGNFLCEWWFYDRYGTGTGATSYADYMALCGVDPVSTSGDYSPTPWTWNQRMSLGAYNQSGYNPAYYQARIMGGAGTFGSGNSWYNTTTPRSVGWHHARIVFGIPDANNYAPVWLYIDNMTNATVYSSTSGVNTGINLLEMNHANSSSGYYDDLTFRAANDPWIVEQPLSQTNSVGSAVYFNTVAIGTAYQWQYNGVNLAGATTSAYSIAAVATSNAGDYTCLITGTNGTVTTASATLTVSGPPVILGPPTSLTVTQSQSASFSVRSAGSAPLSYQWLYNGSPIAGATTNTYTDGNAQPSDAGSYSVVVTNTLGRATSAVAMLTVLQPPAISTQPQSATVATGTCVTLSVEARGSAPLYYQWQWNGAAQGISTSSAYTACNAGTYSVVVSNTAGAVFSAPATVSFTNPPPAQPGHFDAANLQPNGSLKLSMSGSAYSNYVLEYTRYWTNWLFLTNVTMSASGTSQPYFDPSPTTNTARFYRLRVGP